MLEPMVIDHLFEAAELYLENRTIRDAVLVGVQKVK